MDKITQARKLIEEVNLEIPEGMNFEFAIVELPTVRSGKDGNPYWQAYEEQYVTLAGENVYIDGEELSPADIADGLGAALIAAKRYHKAALDIGSFHECC